MKLYDELASWWPLLSHPSEYADEAALYESLLLESGGAPPRTLLELGSGGGNNASFLKSRFDMVLVDVAPAMLAVSRALNPECEHIEGDMRTVRLGRRFDRVFVHDAIVYMKTEAELRAALETAFVHCAPGGTALFAPDHVRETFRSATDCGGRDDGARGLRYLEWTWDPDPADTVIVVDYACVLREADGSTRLIHDRHTEGLFATADWLRLLADAGFDARAVPVHHEGADAHAGCVFVGRAPAAESASTPRPARPPDRCA